MKRKIMVMFSALLVISLLLITAIPVYAETDDLRTRLNPESGITAIAGLFWGVDQDSGYGTGYSYNEAEISFGDTEDENTTWSCWFEPQLIVSDEDVIVSYSVYVYNEGDFYQKFNPTHLKSAGFSNVVNWYASIDNINNYLTFILWNNEETFFSETIEFSFEEVHDVTQSCEPRNAPANLYSTIYVWITDCYQNDEWVDPDECLSYTSSSDWNAYGSAIYGSFSQGIAVSTGFVHNDPLAPH